MLSSTQSNTSTELSEQIKNSGRHFTAGGIAGIIEIGNFRGLVDCARQTLCNEGPTGFYKGLLPPIVIETPKRAFKFMTFDHYGQMLHLDSLPTWMRYSLSGLFTGLTEAYLVCPFEVVKVRLQSELHIPLSQQKSSVTVAREIALTHGWGTGGLYLGIGANLWRHGIWNSCYFGIYHNLRTLFNPQYLPREGYSERNLSLRLSIASLSAICANLANIPFDVAKSRIQGPQPSTGRVYHTTWQTIRLVQRQHGFLSVYKRLLPLAFIFGPGGGMMLVVYEAVYGWLLKHT